MDINFEQIVEQITQLSAQYGFKLVAAPGHSYYRTLREKLGWSGRFHHNDD